MHINKSVEETAENNEPFGGKAKDEHESSKYFVQRNKQKYHLRYLDPAV